MDMAEKHRLDKTVGAAAASYPDPALEVVDVRFEKIRLLAAAVERLWTGGRWVEGPVWFGDGRYLLFSDIPNERILRWSEETGQVSVFRSPSGSANGNTLFKRRLICRSYMLFPSLRRFKLQTIHKQRRISFSV